MFRRGSNIISRARVINNIVFWITIVLVGFITICLIYTAFVFIVTEIFGKNTDFTFIKTVIDFIKNLF